MENQIKTLASELKIGDKLKVASDIIWEVVSIDREIKVVDIQNREDWLILEPLETVKVLRHE